MYGETNPSGKLPFTFPRFAGVHTTYDCKYTETLNNDFKPIGFDPLFHFGHGLSYSNFTYENMKNYISDGEINFPTLCDDFGDEFEYADSVIKWAVDDFLTSNEDVFLDEIYDEVHEIVVDKCKDWFGEYLLNIIEVIGLFLCLK